jgi:hypothetical protein
VPDTELRHKLNRRFVQAYMDFAEGRDKFVFWVGMKPVVLFSDPQARRM